MAVMTPYYADGQAALYLGEVRENVSDRFMTERFHRVTIESLRGGKDPETGKREKGIICQGCGHRSRAGVNVFEDTETGELYFWCFYCAARILAVSLGHHDPELSLV